MDGASAGKGCFSATLCPADSCAPSAQQQPIPAPCARGVLPRLIPSLRMIAPPFSRLTWLACAVLWASPVAGQDAPTAVSDIRQLSLQEAASGKDVRIH